MFRKLLLSTAALLAPTAAQADWYEAKSKHFVVYSDDSLERVKEYTTRLERFDKAVRVLHGETGPEKAVANKVTVYVLPTVEDVGKLAKGTAGFWVPRLNATAFMPRASGSGKGMTSQAIMFHEYTHHWMLTSWSAAAMPAWYTEGAAEFHATAQMRPDGSVLFGGQPTWRMYGIEMFKGQMPVPDLLRAVPYKLDQLQSEALYARGWLLTHYLTVEADRRKQLADYIGAINAGKTIDEAAPLLGNVSDLRLDSYVKQPRFPSLVVPADRLQVGEVTLRKMTAGEAAIMPAVIRSQAGVDKVKAQQVLAMARKVAEAFPNDPAVQNELAEAEYDGASTGAEADAAVGYARAEAAADRALAADPKSVHALLYKGQAKQAVAELGKKTDAATWADIRRWYIAANRADTENAEPLLLYYKSFAAAGQTPTKAAEGGAFYAYALAPQNIDARITAARILMAQDKVPQARVALAAVAYRADVGRETSEELTAVLSALDKGGGKAGLETLKQFEDKRKAAAEKAKKDGKSG